MKRATLLIFALLTALPTTSSGDNLFSMKSSLIDLSRVNKTTSRKLKKMGADQYTRYDQFELSVAGELEPSKYHYNHMAFEIKESIDNVWNAYLSASPKDSWSGKNIQFDFAYSKRDQNVYYGDGDVPNAHEGMGVFILLKILRLGKISAAMEISKIDHETRTIEYTYLLKNTSNGRQIIRLTELGSRKTRLDHDTYFTSGKRWRDAIYPKIHESLVSELHRNVMGQIYAPIIRIE